MTIKGVLFDLNGTLLVCRDDAAAWNDWSHALWQTLRDHAPGHDEQTFRERCNSMFASPEPPPPVDGLSIYEQRIHAFCRAHALSADLDSIRIAAHASVNAWLRHMELDPEAVPLLQHLRKTCRIALVSNFDHPSALRRYLETLNLTGLFDTVLISGDLGCSKPDPKIFQHALAVLNLRPEETLHVGDSDEDILGARAADCRPVRIRRTGPPTELDATCQAITIQSLSALEKLVPGK